MSKYDPNWKEPTDLPGELNDEQIQLELEEWVRKLNEVVEDQSSKDRERCKGCGIADGEEDATVCKRHWTTNDAYCDYCWSELCLDAQYN